LAKSSAGRQGAGNPPTATENTSCSPPSTARSLS
ncbi:hypothetical protein AB1N83_014202, partial [Pleurotus pulmonarius]